MRIVEQGRYRLECIWAWGGSGQVKTYGLPSGPRTTPLGIFFGGSEDPAPACPAPDVPFEVESLVSSAMVVIEALVGIVTSLLSSCGELGGNRPVGSSRLLYEVPGPARQKIRYLSAHIGSSHLAASRLSYLIASGEPTKTFSGVEGAIISTCQELRPSIH